MEHQKKYMYERIPASDDQNQVSVPWDKEAGS